MASADLLPPNLNVKRPRGPMLLGQQVVARENIIGTPEWQERQNHLQKIAAENWTANQKRLNEEELERRQDRAARGIKTRSEAIDGVKQENPLPVVPEAEPARPQYVTKGRGPKRRPEAEGGMGEVPHHRNRKAERERNRPRRPITQV